MVALVVTVLLLVAASALFLQGVRTAERAHVVLARVEADPLRRGRARLDRRRAALRDAVASRDPR